MSTLKKAAVVGVVVTAVVGAFLLGRTSGETESTSSTGSTTTTTKPGETPKTTIAPGSLETELPKEMQLPGGGDDVLQSSGATESMVMALAGKLGLKGVTQTADGWAGDGLKVLSNGRWTYKNARVKDLTPATCTADSPCEEETKTAPEVSTLPNEAVATERAVALGEGSGLLVRPMRATRSKWRIDVYTTGFFESLNVATDSYVFFGENGAVVEARGVLGKWERSMTMKMPSSAEAYRELYTRGELAYKVGRVPAQGEKITVAGVFRLSRLTSAGAGFTTTPGWAFRDTENNVWWVGSTEKMEGVTVEEDPEQGSVPGSTVPPNTAMPSTVPGTTSSDGAPARP